MSGPLHGEGDVGLVVGRRAAQDGHALLDTEGAVGRRRDRAVRRRGRVLRIDLPGHRWVEVEQRGATAVLRGRDALHRLEEQDRREADARQIDAAVGVDTDLDLLVRDGRQVDADRERSGLIPGEGRPVHDDAVLGDLHGDIVRRRIRLDELPREVRGPIERRRPRKRPGAVGVVRGRAVDEDRHAVLVLGRGDHPVVRDRGIEFDRVERAVVDRVDAEVDVVPGRYRDRTQPDDRSRAQIGGVTDGRRPDLRSVVLDADANTVRGPVGRGRRGGEAHLPGDGDRSIVRRGPSSDRIDQVERLLHVRSTVLRVLHQTGRVGRGPGSERDGARRSEGRHAGLEVVEEDTAPSQDEIRQTVAVHVAHVGVAARPRERHIEEAVDPIGEPLGSQGEGLAVFATDIRERRQLDRRPEVGGGLRPAGVRAEEEMRAVLVHLVR